MARTTTTQGDSNAIHKCTVTLLAAAAVSLPAAPAQRTSPTSPSRFVVPFAAGSATDQLARALGQAMTADRQSSRSSSTTRPGGNGFIGAASGGPRRARRLHGARSPPTPRTRPTSTCSRSCPTTRSRTSRPSPASARAARSWWCNPDSPAKTVAEFIAQAKKEPGKISFGSGSSSSRMAGELFQQMAGVAAAARAVQEQPARGDRPAGRPDRHDDHRHRHRPAAGEGRQAARARRVVHDRARRCCPRCRPSPRPASRATTWATGSPPTCRRTRRAGGQAAQRAAVEGREAPAAASRSTSSSGTEVFTTTPEELAKFQAAESQKWGGIIKAAGIETE